MKKVIFTIIIFLVLLFLYGRYIEPNNLKVREYTIKNEKVPTSFQELKIVHFSDLLYQGNNSKYLDKLAKKINDLAPDILVFSGDLFNKNVKYEDKDYTDLKNFLKEIKALYKYAVIGDEDQKYLDKYKDILYDSEFTLLDNQNTLLFYKDITPINIIGLSNIQPDSLNNLITGDVTHDYNLVITHNSDNFASLVSYEIDTVLAGNSLGGIINVPYYGGIIKNRSKTYINEYYQVNNQELYVSNGLGYEKFNFRLMNTPSINVYRFEK